MHYKVTLINNGKDKSTADIYWVEDGKYLHVTSNNPSLRSVLETVIKYDAYIMSPGVNVKGYSSDGVVMVSPDTVEYFQALPQILSWRGFHTVLRTDEKMTHKAVSDEYITYNDKMERIVKRVPLGMVAINQVSGKYLVGGQYLNANIDKEDAEWYLVDNPYEDASPEDREKAFRQMQSARLAYHPGVHSEQYALAASDPESAGSLTTVRGLLRNMVSRALQKNKEEHGKVDIPAPKKRPPSKFDKAPEKPVEEQTHEELLASYTVPDVPDEEKIPERKPKSKESIAEARGKYLFPTVPGVMYSPTLQVAFDGANMEALLPQLIDMGFAKHRWFFSPYPGGERPSAGEVAARNPGGLRDNPVWVPGLENGFTRIDISEEQLLLARGTGQTTEAREARENLPWASAATVKPWIMSVNDSGIVLNDRQTNIVKPPVGEENYDSLSSIRHRNTVSRALSSIRAGLFSTSIASGFKRVYDAKKAGETHVEGLYLEGDPDAPPEAVKLKASFKGREFQKVLIKAITHWAQYEVFGGPKGFRGHFINASYGVGKTVTALASWVVMQNTKINGKNIVERGKQCMVVSAPPKNIESWASEHRQFLSDDVVVVTGRTREERMAVWDSLFERAANGTLPSAIIIPSSFFRKETEDADGNPYKDSGNVENAPPCEDALNLQLLMRGGTRGNGDKVEGRHVASMVIDETGQMVNYATGRQAVLREVLDDLYHSGGVNLTLNGDISGNSASDTISEISFINAEVANNYASLLGRFTEPLAKIGRFVDSRRKWRSGPPVKGQTVEGTPSDMIEYTSRFMAGYAGSVTNFNSPEIFGDAYGLDITDPIISELGHEFGAMYTTAAQSMIALMSSSDENQYKKWGLPFISALQALSFGSLHPARIIEYGLGMDKVAAAVSALSAQGVPESTIKTIIEGMSEYQKRYSERVSFMTDMPQPDGTVERKQMTVSVPREAGGSSNARSSAFIDMVGGEDNFALIERALDAWDVPALDDMVDMIDDKIKNRQGMDDDANVKIVVGGFSKRAIQRIHRKIADRHGAGDLVLSIIDGDTTAAEADRIQKRHQSETKRTVITAVTSAGKYGLNLPSRFSILMPGWNPAAVDQLRGRAHRGPTQEHLSTTVGVSGFVNYVLDVAGFKRGISKTGLAALLESQAFLDAMDDGDTVESEVPDGVNTDEFTRMISALVSHDSFSKPRIREKESKDMTQSERDAIAERSRKQREEVVAPVLKERAEKKKRLAEREAAKNPKPAKKPAKTTQAKKPKIDPSSVDIPAPKPRRVTKKSVIIHKRVYDTPTFTKNPLYQEGN